MRRNGGRFYRLPESPREPRSLSISPKGACLLIAIVIWMIIRYTSRRSSHAPAAHVIAGFAAVLAVMAAYFSSHHALSSLYYANVVWPSVNYSAVNACPYALSIFGEHWRHWAVIPGCTPLVSVPLACILITPFVFVALCAMAMWVSEYHRKDIVHLIFGSPLMAIASLRLLYKSGTRTAPGTLFAFAATSCCCVALRNLIVVLSGHPVRTRAGAAAMFGSGAELAAIDRFVPAGEEMFVFPYCPSYYFLSRTVKPIRSSFLLTGYNPPGEFQSAVQPLQARRTRFVLWDTDFRRKMLPAALPGALRGRDDQLIYRNAPSAALSNTVRGRGLPALGKKR